MSKVITLKMDNGEHLNITPGGEINPEATFDEFLGGRKEFIQVGTVAISKQHIVYMSISDLDPPEEVVNAEESSAESNPLTLCADNGLGGGGGGGDTGDSGELNACIAVADDNQIDTQCCQEGSCPSVQQ